MKIYTGNLAATTTETQLNEAFAAHGAVESCRIPTDKKSGAVKGFGFVEMLNETEANAAIGALNDSELCGNKIQVKESEPKTGQGTHANN